MPVESLGCSPFERLFGRSLNVPFLLQGVELTSAKKNVTEFMLDTRERLRSALDLAHDFAQLQRTKAKTWYNKRARNRTLEPGDKVLIFLPIQGSPMLAKYHRPYEVAARLGEVESSLEIEEKRVGSPL